MTTFGEALRSFRQASNDPDRLNRRLTQERLGMLIGDELGDLGFSAAAVSDWEREKSRINADDRNVLIAVLSALRKCDGLKLTEEADQLLRLGNYRALNEKEIQKIFGDQIELNLERPEEEKSGGLFLLAAIFSVSKEQVDELLSSVKDGPNPIWPRVLAVLMRKASDQFSFSVRMLEWIWVWLLAWWLIAPSLRLPYTSRDAAFRALGMYAVGSILVPLLIGLLVNTKDNRFWKQQIQVSSALLRLYTYQGAGIGFNLGYFFVFPLILLRYYLHGNPSLWLEFLAAGFGLLLGNIAAYVVPHNLWRAYGRLTFKDGWIFCS